VQFFQQWSQADDAVKRADALDQHHELAMLFGEFVVNLLEYRSHRDSTRMIFPGGQVPMSVRNILVEEVMSTGVFTLGRNEKLSVADDLMKQERIRHIPVLDSDGELCGILTQRDLFRGILLRSLGYGSRAEQKMLDSLSVKDAMHDEVVSISPDSPLSDAANLMLSNKVGCLPVVDGERLVGLISEADFVKQFASGDA